MDPYLIAEIISYQIDDVPDSALSTLSKEQKTHLLRGLEDKYLHFRRAFERGSLEGVKLFLPFARNIPHYLLHAVSKGFGDIFQYIIETDPFDHRSLLRGDRYPLIQVICENKDTEMLRLLIDNGVNPNTHLVIPDKKGREGWQNHTLLSLSVLTNNIPMMRMLLEKKALVKDANFFAVQVAVRHKNMTALKELIPYVPDEVIASDFSDHISDEISSLFLDKIIKNRWITEAVINNCIQNDEANVISQILEKDFKPDGKCLLTAIRLSRWECASVLHKYGVRSDEMGWYDHYCFFMNYVDQLPKCFLTRDMIVKPYLFFMTRSYDDVDVIDGVTGQRGLDGVIGLIGVTRDGPMGAPTVHEPLGLTGCAGPGY